MYLVFVIRTELHIIAIINIIRITSNNATDVFFPLAIIVFKIKVRLRSYNELEKYGEFGHP